ncbi:MAG: hypothetical protein HY252_05885 [Sphingobacteriales bacterium]|nr:hypothetical protein [Sphingobacteriales bacterium]
MSLNIQNFQEGLAILEPRFRSIFLEGYFDSFFNKEKTKLLAFTYSIINPESDIFYDLTSMGHSCYLSKEEHHAQNKYIDSDTFQMKSVTECIQEGIFGSYSFRFIGHFYNKEWYILKELIFFGKSFSEREVKKNLMKNYLNFDFWESDIFDTYKKAIYSKIDLRKDNYEDEFAELPMIVSEIKKTRKENINRAYTHYMNQEIFLPFIEKLQIKHPELYKECYGLYGVDYTLIFPESKSYTIIVFQKRDANGNYTIEYFLFLNQSKKIYKWIYFNPEVTNYSFHYALEIIKNLEKISNWNDCGFLNSSWTMDDPKFWNEYVLKMQDGKFLYLEEVNV